MKPLKGGIASFGKIGGKGATKKGGSYKTPMSAKSAGCK